MGDNFTVSDKSIRQIIQMPPNQHPPSQLGVLVPVPATIQHIQKEKQEKKEVVETDDISVNELAAKASGLHKEYGQLVARLLLSHENKSNELKISNKVVNELRAEKEVINGQLIESNDQNVRLNGKIEDVEKKAELIFQRAKSEESICRNKFIELNEKHTALKKESDEKDNNIRVLKEKDTDNESKIAQQNVQVLNFEMSERRLKKDLEVKEKEVECFSKKVMRLEINIMEEKGKVRNLESSEQKLNEKFLKMKVDYNKMTTTNEELNTINNNFVEKETANEKAMQELETNFKLRLQELEEEISEKSNEIASISHELDEERKDKRVDQEKMNGQIKVLCEQVKVFKKGDKVTIKKLKTERDELKLRVKELKDELKAVEKINVNLRTKLETILEMAQSSVLPENPKKQHKQKSSYSSSSYKEETSPEASMAADPESSSSSNTENRDSENNGNSTHSETNRLEPLVVSKLSSNKTPGKRKNPPKTVSSEVKKQREDVSSLTDQNGPQNKLITFTEISQMHFNQKSNTEGNTEIPEKSSTSRSTRSSSGRMQGNQNDNTQ